MFLMWKEEEIAILVRDSIVEQLCSKNTYVEAEWL